MGALDHADDPWIVKNGEALRAALDTVRGHLGWVLVEANVSGADLRVDGRHVGKLPLPRVRLLAGAGHVEVSAPGHEGATRAIVVAPRTEVKVVVQLVATPPPLVVPERSLLVVEGPPTRVRTSRWTMVGVGAVSLGAFSLGLGAFFAVRTLDRKHERDAHCSPAGCDEEGLVADRAARFSSTMALTTLGLGLVATVGGLVLLVRSPASPVVVTSAAGPHHLAITVGSTW